MHKEAAKYTTLAHSNINFNFMLSMNSEPLVYLTYVLCIISIVNNAIVFKLRHFPHLFNYLQEKPANKNRSHIIAMNAKRLRALRIYLLR